MNSLYQEAVAGPANPTLWWLGQASFLLALDGQIILIDPCIALKGEDPLVNEIDLKLFRPLPLRAEEVERCDIAVISHEHIDHLAPKTSEILAANTSCAFVGPRRVMEALAAKGVPEERLVDLPWGDRIACGPVAIESTPAEHEGLGEGGACGFFIESEGFRMWYPGDTDPLPLHRTYTGLDLLVLGIADHVIGGMGGRELLSAIRPRVVVPCHYGTFDVNQIWAKGDPEGFGLQARPYCERYEPVAVGGKVVIPRRAAA